MTRSRRGLRLATGVVALLVLWQLVVLVLRPPSFLVPSPLSVLVELARRPQLYAVQLWITFLETLIGFAAGCALGLVAATLVVRWRWLEDTLYPLLLFLQVVPKVAIAPLLIVWLGFGLEPRVVVAALVAFFPVVIDTITGLRNVDEELIELVTVLCCSRRQEFWKIRFPSALPSIFSGLKVAVTLAVIGAVIGEFVGGSSGLGYLIVLANTQLDVSMSFAALVLLSALGLVLFGAVSLLERVLIPWAPARATRALIT
ncbi:MAG TPA: ABC transporter permease [Candidatus Dormibacteraeota bacterium]|nr:ABC transporter permease [Candidatus Dormibacteraeota bacterium]